MKVLVLMATYNGQDFIKEQLQSILNQNNVSVDILVSDDKSTDDTVGIINSYIEQGFPIKVIQRQIGTGSAAKNFMSLIQRVEKPEQYAFFALSDQDDIWLPNKLSDACNSLVNGPADLYASNLIRWDQSTDEKTIIKKDQAQRKYDFLFEGGSAGCTYVLNLSLFKKVKAVTADLSFDRWEGFSHDWLIYFIARANGFQVYLDHQAHILYRIHGSNLHGHLNASSFSALKARLDLIRQGWYIHHINGYMPLLAVGTSEYEIYAAYKKNLFSRVLMLLKYNFSLLRSPVKFIQFFLLSLIPQQIGKR